jgi:hypothetical protein
MRAAELRKMERFFTSLTELQRYMSSTAATAAELGTCDCEITRDGIYRMAGRCVPSGPADPPPDHCRTVVHLAARTLLDGLRLPTAHLSDPQLAKAIAGMAALVDRAPDLTQRRFVIDLQTVLGAGLGQLIPAAPTTEEETPGA